MHKLCTSIFFHSSCISRWSNSISILSISRYNMFLICFDIMFASRDSILVYVSQDANIVSRNHSSCYVYIVLFLQMHSISILRCEHCISILCISRWVYHVCRNASIVYVSRDGSNSILKLCISRYIVHASRDYICISRCINSKCISRCKRCILRLWLPRN